MQSLLFKIYLQFNEDKKNNDHSFESIHKIGIEFWNFPFLSYLYKTGIRIKY